MFSMAGLGDRWKILRGVAIVVSESPLNPIGPFSLIHCYGKCYDFVLCFQILF